MTSSDAATGSNGADADSVQQPDCMDAVSDVMGVGAMEVESGGNASRHPAMPRRQISNVSMPKKKSGICGASSNLVNSIVGAGIIGIPYALRESGIVAGVLLLILVAYCTDKSLRIIVELATFHPTLQYLGVHTFEDLMSLPFGPSGHRFILLNMFVLAYGAMVAYLLIIKDTVPSVLGIAESPGVGSFFEREVVMIVTSLSIMVPLSIQRDMASLAFTSLLSVSADVLLVVFIGAYAPIRSSVSDAGGIGTVVARNAVNSHLFIGLGILSTAMACQHSAFIVSGSLANKTSQRWGIVTFRSIAIATVLCAILGICGYLAYLNDTKGDILNNFQADTVEANGARALLAITMFFTYPMEAFVARHVFVQLVYGGDMDGHIIDPSTGTTMPEPKTLGILNRRHKVTLLIYLATLVPALLVDDLGPVLSITGSLGGSLLSYVAPGLVYLGVHGDDFLEYIANVLQSKQPPSKATPSGAATFANPESQIPVEGDANATMETITSPKRPDPNASKPWWWYPTLMPLWVHIATVGSNGMNERLNQFQQEHGHIPSTNLSNADQSSGDRTTEAIGPRTQDYFVSMFFIAFGMLAAVVGVISNVYVEVNNVFFTPT